MLVGRGESRVAASPGYDHLASHPTLYIAEHDPHLRGALAFALEAEGYGVTLCDSGESLLGLSLPPRDACLIIDNQLTGLSGMETLARLRRHGVDLPAIVLVGAASAALTAWARRLQAVLVDKPLDSAAFLAAVRRLL